MPETLDGVGGYGQLEKMVQHAQGHCSPGPGWPVLGEEL